MHKMLAHPHKLMLQAKTVMAQFAYKSQEDPTNLFCSRKFLLCLWIGITPVPPPQNQHWVSEDQSPSQFLINHTWVITKQSKLTLQQPRIYIKHLNVFILWALCYINLATFPLVKPHFLGKKNVFNVFFRYLF